MRNAERDRKEMKKERKRNASDRSTGKARKEKKKK